MNIKALSYSANITLVVITFLTIVGELNKPLKNTLASIGGHHWVGKGIVALAVFILGYVVIRTFADKKSDTDTSLCSTIAVTVLSGVLIVLFFVFHTYTNLV